MNTGYEDVKEGVGSMEKTAESMVDGAGNMAESAMSNIADAAT